MSPQQHDECVAAISHLPHVVASVLAASTAEKQLRFAASGWKDTTRVAAGNVELWLQILSQNPDHILKSVDKFEQCLATFRAALEQGDWSQVSAILEAGKQNRDAVGN
jgi:prephenate dehydrogenase